MGPGLHIDDLRQPQLNDQQQAAVDYADSLSVQLSVEAVLDEARRQTGLDDFGPEDFIARLQIQLQSVAEDPWMNNIGRLTVFNEKVLNAANRLRVMDYLQRHPEIDAVELPRPIIIVGLPRSGTTHLVNMIAADHRLRSLPYWESRQPVPSLGEPTSRDPEDPRFQRCAKAWKMQDALLPLLKNMHAMIPDHIHEEIELQDIDFSSYTLEWIAHVPRWRDYYLSHDQGQHYRFLRRMLQLLSHQAGPQQWVLKSPQHLEQLLPLYQNFPDATIAITHRDPMQVIASAVTMIAYGSRLRNRVIHTEEIATYWIDRVEKLLTACVRDIDKLPAERTLNVFFDEFMADDMAMVRRIYKLAGLELDATAEARISTYLQQNPRGKHGQIRYDLAGDFGVDPNQLYERFRFYYQRYPQIDPGPPR